MSDNPTDTTDGGRIFEDSYLKGHPTPRDIELLVQETFEAERRLEDERDRRRKDWSDTNKLALSIGIAIIGLIMFIFVGGIWYTNGRVDTLLVELRDLRERVAVIEAMITPELR